MSYWRRALPCASCGGRASQPHGGQRCPPEGGESMWNRPAPYIDDSDDSATRPFISTETPTQQPARVRSALRRALRVLIPTVVAGAVVIGFAAVALGNRLPRIGTTAGALRPT